MAKLVTNLITSESHEFRKGGFNYYVALGTGNRRAKLNLTAEIISVVYIFTQKEKENA